MERVDRDRLVAADSELYGSVVHRRQERLQSRRLRSTARLVYRLLDTDHYGEKIVGMQIFLEGVAVGLFQRFQKDSPDPLVRELIQLVLRDESRHAGFGVIYLADKFRGVSAAERARVEAFVAELCRLFHHATASPFGPVNEFLSATFSDIAHRLKLIGLDLKA
jgi:hypothetical protein